MDNICLFKVVIGSSVSMAHNAAAVQEALTEFKENFKSENNLLVSSSYLGNDTVIYPYSSVKDFDTKNYQPCSLTNIYAGLKENLEDCKAIQNQLTEPNGAAVKSVVTLFVNNDELIPNKAIIKEVKQEIKDLSKAGTVINVIEFGHSALGIGKKLGVNPECILQIKDNTTENLKGAFEKVTTSLTDYMNGNAEFQFEE